MGRRQRLRKEAAAHAPVAPKPDVATPAPRKLPLLPVAVLLVATFLVFSPVGSHPFITLDDPDYITHNDMVLAGLTGRGISWAFTTFHAANWHPVTWISHMLDVSLFGTSSGAHLLMNVFLHALAAVALFGALHALTGFAGRSLTVALLFALHPLAVQSVAWISERKNVLCALFWFAGLWAYAIYARTNRRRDYAFVVLFFALSLLAKPMSVTLPAALLLIDYWPLGRVRIADKLPLFALSAISSLVTLRAQGAGQAIETLQALPLSTRIANAFVSYARYLGKTFWPSDLAIFYPYHRPGALATILAALLLVAITAGAWLARKRRPFVLAGWLWFLGTLVPMIGIVQVGSQSIADRYMYVSIVGLGIALVWSIAELGEARTLAVVATVVFVVLGLRTFVQLEHWRTSEELFAHTIAVAGPSELAHNNLGMAYVDAGDDARGEAEFRKSLAINPEGLDARVNLANALARQERTDEAIAAYEKALEIAPLPDIHNNLGVALARKGRMAEAVPHFHEALRIDPNFAPAQQILQQLAAQGVDVGRR